MKHLSRAPHAHAPAIARALLPSLLLACSAPHRAGSPAAAAAGTHTPKAVQRPQEPLRERLQRELGSGRPVAVVASAVGVIAVGLDSRQQPLVEGIVDWVFVDDRAGVVWYQARAPGGYELRLLDWSTPSPRAERIATGLGGEDAVELSIAYAESAYGPEEIQSRTSDYDGYVRLLLTAAGPAWSYESGIYDHIFEREAQRRAKLLEPLAFAPGAEARLRELNERARGKHLLLGAVAGPKPAAPGVAPERCWDTSLCGSGQPLPGTPWWRVIVSHECGDACHVRHQLFDPARREFFDPASGRRSPSPIDTGNARDVEDVWIAAGGEGFVIAGSVYDRSGKLLFRGDRRGGGWLGGQWQLR